MSLVPKKADKVDKPAAREPLTTRSKIEDELNEEFKSRLNKERAEAQKERRAKLVKQWKDDRKAIDAHKEDAKWLDKYIKEHKRDAHEVRAGQFQMLLNPYELAVLQRALLQDGGYKSVREMVIALAEKHAGIKW
ncbi:hypothetical protein R7P74_23530 [Vibrio sp. 2033]|uniref:hypothetical protein n=1 Tax=Vibrio sp. 2033 TaxID=3074589 RepID=UPI002964A0C8|nr:hypothetical protein [Vibrio sp. 2033]MDW2126605.1 hypothetical protein [Vibrio sp. 2033]